MLSIKLWHVMEVLKTHPDDRNAKNGAGAEDGI